MNDGLCIGFGIGLLTGFMVGVMLGGGVATTHAHRTAAEAGVAEYVVDPFTGKTEFRWKPPCPDDDQQATE